MVTINTLNFLSANIFTIFGEHSVLQKTWGRGSANYPSPGLRR